MKNKITQFNCLFGFLGITTCIYSTFIMPYLRAKGFTVTELGVFSSINITLSIFGQFIFGYLCDATKTIKKIIIFNIITLFMIALTMQLNTNTALIVGFIAAFGFFQGPLSVLCDSWVLSSEKTISQSFGSIRAWSSVGWALCAILMGTVIEKFGWKVFFLCYMIMLLVTLTVILNIADIHKSKKPSNKDEKINPFTLFKDYRYLFIVIIMLLLTTTHQTMSFLYVKINNLGGNSKHIGISSFVMAISELPIFFSSKYIVKKFRLTSLLIFCSGMYMIRMLLLSISSSYIQVIALGILQMVTFAVYVIGYKFFIADIAPSNLQVTAQSVAASICAIGSIIFSSVAGYLIDKHGINALFTIGVVTSAVAMGFLLLYTVLIRRNKLKEVKINE